MNGCNTPLWLDRNALGGGILLYVREDIPSKYLLVEDNPIEGLLCNFIEITLH